MPFTPPARPRLQRPGADGGRRQVRATVMLVSSPVSYGGRFLGMVGSVVDLQFLIRRLQEVSGGGLTPYVVDRRDAWWLPALRNMPPART